MHKFEKRKKMIMIMISQRGGCNIKNSEKLSASIRHSHFPFLYEMVCETKQMNQPDVMIKEIKIKTKEKRK